MIINKTIRVWSWFYWYKETVDRARSDTHTHTHFFVLIVYIEHITFKMITKHIRSSIAKVGYFIKIKHKHQLSVSPLERDWINVTYKACHSHKL